MRFLILKKPAYERSSLFFDMGGAERSIVFMKILIIGGFTYYTSVAQDQPFKSRFLEMAVISISVAVVSFIVGILAKRFLGVDL